MSENLNVTFVELKEFEKGNSKERAKDFQKIQNFIRNLRSDLKLKNSFVKIIK